MNNEYKCIDDRGYSLTTNKEYEVLKKEGSFVFVNNDKGKIARYSAEMFKEIEIVPPPQIRTEEDCINSIINEGNQTKYVDLNNELKTIENIFNVVEPGNAFSCGVRMIVNINNTMDQINDITQSDQNIAGDDLLDLQKALLKSHLKNYMIRLGEIAGIYLVSTNLNYNEDLVYAIDDIADFQSQPEINPNSGNQIKVWGFLKSNL